MRLTYTLYTILLEELMSGPSTTASLCEVSGMERKSVHAFIRALRSRGLAYISGWDKDRNGRVIVPVYSFGEGKDVRRKPKTQAQACRDYRVRKAKGHVSEALAGIGA